MGGTSSLRRAAWCLRGTLGLLSLGLACGSSTSSEVSGVEADAGPPIPGARVSAAALRSFLGGKAGVLIWVSDGKLRVLDFRGDAPEIRTLSEELDAVNPLLSPDGTRLVHSQGNPNGPKFVLVRRLDGGPATRLGIADIGYWHLEAGEESIVYADWSNKDQDGAGGNTYRQRLIPSSVEFLGERELLHDRAMDAGPNRTLGWLGQVYGQMIAYHLESKKEYGPDRFFLRDGARASHQTCNGSMAPDDSARLMVLVIPHDNIRVFSHQPSTDTFRETARYVMPAGELEWEFPEWSTHPDFFTTVLRSKDLENHLMLVKHQEGESTPKMLEIVGKEENATYSHLHVEPR